MFAYVFEARAIQPWIFDGGRLADVVGASELVDQIAKDDMVRGNTISAVGFYGPQGRELRLPLANPDLNVICFSGDGDSLAEGMDHLIFLVE